MNIFTPLISVIMICIFSALTFLGIRKTMLNELNFCVKEATKIQKAHRKLTNKLLTLNSTARTLRTARKAAEFANKIAIIPKAKIAARVALKFVKSLQRTNRVAQQKYLSEAYLRSSAFVIKMVNHGYYPKRTPKGLQVKKIYENTDSPEYILKKDYSEKTKIRFYKKYSIFKNTPKVLLKFIKKKDAFKSFNCGSTLLEKEEKPWQVKLIMDK